MVTMGPSGSYTIRAEAQDGSGQAIGVLHTPDAKPKANLSAPNWGPRLLSYAQLRALEPTSPPLGARNTIVLDLMGDMSTYTWTINGFVYPTPDPKISARPQDPPEALVITTGDRVFVSIKNLTKMWHPMHVHGHFFRLLSPGLDDEFRPLKHTVNVPPGALVRFEFVADNPGRWFFHCHNLYHLIAGMAREFIYKI
jgi:FtsP/CotA-like multicopper oxidase with cupredoxin domain